VRLVYYPGLEEHPGHGLLERQGRGFGAMIAFEVTDHALVEQLLLGTELISFAESLGGVETLITFPQVQTHADIEPEKRARLGINDRLLRLSVGIEDVDDLIADLERAFARSNISSLPQRQGDTGDNQESTEFLRVGNL
jgi:cystathionine gamma-synthase/cystathionine beta-lyase